MTQGLELIRCLRAHLRAVEIVTDAADGTRYMFHWSSQNEGLALERWKRARRRHDHPLLPTETLISFQFGDLSGRLADDWTLADLPCCNRALCSGLVCGDE